MKSKKLKFKDIKPGMKLLWSDKFYQILTSEDGDNYGVFDTTNKREKEFIKAYKENHLVTISWEEYIYHFDIIDKEVPIYKNSAFLKVKDISTGKICIFQYSQDVKDTIRLSEPEIEPPKKVKIFSRTKAILSEQC